MGPLGAAVVGLAAGIVCAYVVLWKFKFGYDDSLDVVGVHFTGGVVGTVLIGLFATSMMTSDAEGLFYGGGLALLGKQVIAIFAVALYTFLVSFGIGKVIDWTIGFRVSAKDEREGVDFSEHAETAYADLER